MDPPFYARRMRQTGSFRTFILKEIFFSFLFLSSIFVSALAETRVE
jgi:hypothetical protein